MAQIEFLDNLLKEYLSFRGFSNSLKSLENEQRNEKDQSFKAEKVMEKMNQAIQSHDLDSLRTLWMHMNNNLFSRLEHTYLVAVKKLENSLLKLYLVTAYSTNKTDKVNEFFSKLAVDLQQQNEWKDWFYFPFCKNPEESPIFALYFTKQWQDTFQISFINFLTTVYQCLPQPTFVRADQDAMLIRRLQEENLLMRNRLQQIVQKQQLTNSSHNLNHNGDGNSRKRSAYKTRQSLNDIIPFDVSPPGHIVDDFCIIATEVNNVSRASDSQARGLKMLIRNIGGSPVMGRRDNVDKANNRRSGSLGRSWI